MGGVEGRRIDTLEEHRLATAAGGGFIIDNERRSMQIATRSLADATEFFLRPDPILSLEAVIGFHPRRNARKARYMRTLRFGNEVCYSTANMLVAVNTQSGSQRFFFEHKTHIDEFVVSPEYLVTCSAVSAERERIRPSSASRTPLQEVEVIAWSVA